MSKTNLWLPKGKGGINWEIGMDMLIHVPVYMKWGFPGGLVVKNSPANAGDAGSIPRSGRYPGEGNGNPLQYSCLENPMDRGALQAIVQEVKSQT